MPKRGGGAIEAAKKVAERAKPKNKPKESDSSSDSLERADASSCINFYCRCYSCACQFPELHQGEATAFDIDHWQEVCELSSEKVSPSVDYFC